MPMNLDSTLAGLVAGLLLLSLAGCSDDGVTAEAGEAGAMRDLTDKSLASFTGYVPPQCYTKTRTAGHAQAANPCYVCHTESRAPNFIDDADLQLAYDFANPRRTARKNNPWTNLFKDYRNAVARVPDREIRAYVRADNYRDDTGRIALADRLADVPAGWDANGDGRWQGYVPDVYFDFDAAGYDHAPGGAYTGWRAFAYTPVPGSFIPANGSFDDVLIRLPRVFRQDRRGRFDVAVYTLNLAITESLIKRADVPIAATDEHDYDIDLNRDGHLDIAHRVVYDWAPLQDRDMAWVGRAAATHRRLAAGLYPEGTEFLHTLRYLDVVDGTVVRAPRMKELRYARKQAWLTYSDRRAMAFDELKEAHDFPDRPAQFAGDVERGVANGLGWVYQGFIEDARGDLRPQTFAETNTCMGCHGGVGATTDASFAFPRKRAGNTPDRGWYYWNQRAMAHLAEPRLTDGRGEYSTYLRNARAGDEFRNNADIIARFFTPAGAEKPAAFRRLEQTIGAMILPSPDRALALDKAYREIVRQQSFIHGRTAHVAPMDNVHRAVAPGEPTGVSTPVSVEHDARAH
ncbi:hypothetical protein D3260_15355 [Salinisphaera sp. Q1T1-3]|nr:hypothetical protein D3260_15355 [Salinisphaera sp. Q1T1-3]